MRKTNAQNLGPATEGVCSPRIVLVLGVTKYRPSDNLMGYGLRRGTSAVLETNYNLATDVIASQDPDFFFLRVEMWLLSASDVVIT